MTVVRVGVLGVGLASASCALVFEDYPVQQGGAGGAPVATSQTTSVASTTGEADASSTSGGPPSCERRVLAMDQLYIDTLPDGSHSAFNPAWKYFGADIDGLDTMGDYGAHCLPRENGNPYFLFNDGVDGIDNSFGKNLASLFGTLSDDVNAYIDAGSTGYFIDIVDLGAMPDQSNLTTRLYAGAQTMTRPDFEGAFCWPVDGATVTDLANVETAKVALAGGTLADEVWSSGPPQTLQLVFRYKGVQIPLTLYHAVIEATLTPAHDATAPETFGRISGILDTEEFVATASRYVAAALPTICSSFESAVAAPIRQASDILLDGTQDHALPCDGISVGFGFTARPILLGGVESPSVTPAVPCEP